jgi:AbiTii
VTQGENMPALVPELVNMASDPAVSISDLLRRALVAARRLDVPDLVGWLTSELNGYTGEVPEYRKIRGHLEAMNPYHVPVPLQMAGKGADWLTLLPERGSIPELEPLSKGTGTLHRHFPTALEQEIMKAMNVPMRPHLMFTTIQIRGIVERVRSRILEWALDLEGRGVLGEGMTFTQQEKQTVQEQHYHFGNVSGSQIQISSNGSTQTQANTTTGTDLEALRGLIEAMGTAIDRNAVQGDAADELRAELATLKAQAASPKPKWEIIRTTARTIKAVAEGAAGNILGELAKPHVATLVALAAGAAGA